MGIGSRRNGKVYYYQKQREGDRVISRHVGGRLVADKYARAWGDILDPFGSSQQSIKPGLSEMLIAGQGIHHVMNSHYFKRDTVSKAPFLVRSVRVERER